MSGVKLETKPIFGAQKSDSTSRTEAAMYGVGMAAFAGAASMTPSSFARPKSVQLISTLLLRGIGFGIGYGLATHIDRVGAKIDSDHGPAMRALEVAGVGMGVWGATRAWARFGSKSTYVRPLIGSIAGTVGMAALGGAAMLAITSEDSPVRKKGDDLTGGRGKFVSIGIGVMGLMGATIGAFALLGRLGHAPTNLKAARSILMVGDEILKGITPAAAKAMYKAKLAAGKEHFLSYSGVGEAGWGKVSKAAQNILAGRATPEEILQATGKPALAEPIRVTVSSAEGTSLEDLARISVDRFEAAGGFKRKYGLIIAPVATGNINPLIPYSSEVMARGNIGTIVAAPFESKPYLSLHRIGEAAKLHKLVINEFTARATKLGSDTELLTQALCYGSGAAQAATLRDGLAGAEALGIDHMLLIGTPGISFTQRRVLRSIEKGLEPGGFVTHSGKEIEAAYHSGEHPFATWVLNDDDPMRLNLTNAFRAPRSRVGDTKKTFLPVVTLVNEFLDSFVEGHRLRGGYAEVGHDYRAVTPKAVRLAYGFNVPDDQLKIIETQIAKAEKLKLLAIAKS